MRRELEGDPLKILKPYLGHWDVPDEGDLVLTIDKIYEDEVKNQHGTEVKPIIYFMEPDAKPMILNKTNRDSITKLHGRRTKSNNWHGKKIALYAAQESKSADGFALRIRPYLPKSNEIICEECGSVITDQVIDGVKRSAKAIAANGITRFNKELCWDCYQRAKAEKAAEVEADA